MTTLAATITQALDETSEIRSLALRPASGPVAFAPGAHIDVHLPGGLIRQYSLWNGSEDTDAYLIGVKREPKGRGGSATIHALKEGDQVQISAPRNSFELQPGAGPALLLAGGIGITPLLSMAQHLAVKGRAHRLHLFVRGLSHVPFRERLDALHGVAIHVGLAPPALDDVLAGLLRRTSRDAQLYLCGPRPFMDLVEAIAQSTGWSEDQIHLERFAADPEAEVGIAQDFDVVINSSGQMVHVNENQTIAEALDAAGVDVLTSCEQGVCGTCQTPVLSGQPDHRDDYLSAAEKAAGESIMICVSRCKAGPLVLDL